jgi:hypothetical protein
MKFSTFVMSCRERHHALAATLTRLSHTGWPALPRVILDDGVGERRIDRIRRTWRRVMQHTAAEACDAALLLEDDIVFGRWFVENLLSWAPLRNLPPSRAFYASLYNPGRPFIRRNLAEHYLVADPRSVWGAQAIVTTPATARFIEAHWDESDGNPDQRMPFLAGRVTPIYFHAPSLVDHAPEPTTWGGMEHAALDFDMNWRAAEGTPTRAQLAPG